LQRAYQTWVENNSHPLVTNALTTESSKNKKNFEMGELTQGEYRRGKKECRKHEGKEQKARGWDRNR